MKKAFLLATLFCILFFLVSLIRHNHFFSQGQDLGIFTQSAWLFSQNLTPFNTITQRMDYQDRYKPIMLVLGLLFKIWADPRMLLMLQSFFLSFSGFFIYLLSKKFNLSTKISYSIMVVYLLFPGVTSFIIDDFHEVSIFPFLFLGGIYFYLNKSKILYPLLILSLLIRDYLVIFSLIFWISIYFSKNKYLLNKYWLKIIFINILALFLMIVSIKHAGGIAYGSFNNRGDNLFDSIFNFIFNPFYLIKSFFLPVIKIKTILISLGYFLFIPITNIWIIVPIIFQLAGRFLDFEHIYRWEIFYHYSGELAAVLAFGLIISLSKVSVSFRKYIVICLLGISLISMVAFHSPLLLLRKPEFWKKEDWMNNIDYILNLIPNNSSVSAQNNLVPHLSLRKEIYILPVINNADYIVMDLRLGQDRFNFYTLTYEEMKQLQLVLIDNYQLISQKGEVYLYKKNHLR